MNNSSNIQAIWAAIVAAINNHDTIIFHRHILPDGDAIGSQLAWKQLITINFPTKNVYAVGTMVPSLQFLGEMDNIPDNYYQNALVIISDTANQLRIDDERWKLAPTVIKIDHHPNRDPYGHWQWVDPTYPATCEMIANFIFAHNWQCDELTAKCLLVGIISDTTRFMLRAISNRTFALTSKLLICYDNNITTIYQQLDNKTSVETRFLSYCYRHYKLSPHGVILLVLPQSLLQQKKITASRAAEYVNIFSNIINHPLWIVAVEYPDTTIRCELRSNNANFLVNSVAQKFGGGGHNSAAGCKLLNWQQWPLLVQAVDELLASEDKFLNVD